MLSQMSNVVSQRVDINGISVVAHDLGDVASADDVRLAVMDVRERLGQTPAVVAMTGTAKGRPTIVIATNESARERNIKAGILVSVAAKILGGGGGGKPDVRKVAVPTSPRFRQLLTRLLQQSLRAKSGRNFRLCDKVFG